MSLIKSHDIKKIILLLTVLITSSCGGGYSPWETEVDCKDYYQDNLKRLAKIEAATVPPVFLDSSLPAQCDKPQGVWGTGPPVSETQPSVL